MIKIAHLEKYSIERRGKQDHPQYRYEREGIYHHRECPHHADLRDLQYGVALSDGRFHDCHEHCRETFTEISYEGATLTTREINQYHDSDFYAVVWDEPKGKLIDVTYATTRAWTYHNTAKIDATPEVEEKARAWLAEWAEENLSRHEAKQATEVRPGRRAVVARGRKIPIGTKVHIGLVEKGRWGLNARVDDGESQYWIAAKNLDILTPEVYRRSEAEIKEKAERIAQRAEYHAPFAASPIVM